MDSCPASGIVEWWDIGMLILKGIDRIRFADTVGIMGPMTMFETIMRLTSQLYIDIGVHTHNDFGMATANANSALAAGADFVMLRSMALGSGQAMRSWKRWWPFWQKERG